MAVHQAPTNGEDFAGIAQLHFEFYPPQRMREKLKYLAGSELGAGAFIVDVLPEASAAALREAAVPRNESSHGPGQRQPGRRWAACTPMPCAPLNC